MQKIVGRKYLLGNQYLTEVIDLTLEKFQNFYTDMFPPTFPKNIC